MVPNNKTARLAGFLWLLVCIFGIASQVFVRDKLFVHSDMAATANNIIANEFLFRLGIVSDVMMLLCTLFTSLVLYKLLGSVNKNRAAVMVIFVILGTAIGMINLLNEFTSLQLLSGAEYLSVFEAGQLQAQAMLSLDLYEQGYVIAQIFFMLWVLPLGLLVYKSGFLPRAFGILFTLETCGGLLSTLIHFLAPNAALETNFLLPGAIAEISFTFWLIIRGINESKVKAVNEVIQG